MAGSRGSGTRVRRSAAGMAVLAVAVLLAGFVPAPVAAAPIDPDWTPPRTVYVPETGQTVDRLFLDLWRGGGGALSFGNPITPELTEDDGRVVQYYEYARFEYWPEGDPNGNLVTLGGIGAELRPVAVARRAVGRGAAGVRTRGMVADAAGAARAWEPMEEAEAVERAAEGDDPYRRDTYRYVPTTGHGVWGGFRAFWEATGEAAYLGNPLTEEYAVGAVSYQVFERGQLAWAEGTDIRMVPVGDLLARRYGLPMEPVEQGDVPTYREDLFVPPIAVPDAEDAPGPPTPAGRSLVISLGRQALWAYENGKVVRSTYVSTGTEKFRTPPGLFYVNSKIPVQDMAGVIGGEAYDVPRVPDVMYFTDRGHAIHGAYWHDNFGNPMSHGCVNLPLDVSKWLYDWASVGLPVLIVP